VSDSDGDNDEEEEDGSSVIMPHERVAMNSKKRKINSEERSEDQKRVAPKNYVNLQQKRIGTAVNSGRRNSRGREITVGYE
jgi:hypothetical protein